jgi:integral membrane sensor domain MASE1
LEELKLKDLLVLSANHTDAQIILACKILHNVTSILAMVQLHINVLMELATFLQSIAIVREPSAGMVLAKPT